MGGTWMSSSRTLVTYSHLPRDAIDEQPVESELLYGIDEFFKFDRLCNVAVYPELVALHHVAVFFRGGHDHDGNHLGAFIRLDAAQDLQPVDFRKLEVKQHNPGAILDVPVRIGTRCEDEMQRLLTVLDTMHVVRHIFLLERTKGHFGVLVIVLDQKDFDFVITGHALILSENWAWQIFPFSS